MATCAQQWGCAEEPQESSGDASGMVCRGNGMLKGSVPCPGHPVPPAMRMQHSSCTSPWMSTKYGTAKQG